jgi:hypothetical protein
MEPVSRAITAESATNARRMFAVAWLFLAVSAALGLLLRAQSVVPLAGLNYGYLLHAHSHIAFLGWVFNAFFALALRFFALEADSRSLWRLFIVTQVAVLGMLVTYPLQGYARESITFSTVHMVCAGIFAWKLWRRNRASGVAQLYLRAALVFMLLSGLGPLALGPLAALGMRDSPWYALSIYFYLHFQYNGWFLFFLKATALQRLAEPGHAEATAPARRAFGWLVVGCVLTVALSSLWLNPPLWVFAVGAAGAAAQLIGVALLRPLLHPARRLFTSPAAKAGAVLALAALLAKYGLQLVSGWPALAEIAAHRFAVIAFLHLVFLGVATPMLVAWALELGWMRWNRLAAGGAAAYLAGALATQLPLAYTPFASAAGWSPWPQLATTLAAGSLLMALGVLGLGAGLRWRQAVGSATS